MWTKPAIIALALTASFPGLCLAQGSTATGAVGGAAAGAVIGGPPGAIIGGTVGAAIGAANEPPPGVVTYVEREDVPSVRVEDEVVVGRPLPRTVKIYRVPRDRHYAYAVVNERRVIVDPDTRTVIKVVK